MALQQTYFSLGSNLGDRRAHLEEALRLMDRRFGTTCRSLSGFLETEPWGFDSDDLFLNAVVRYDLDADAHDILKVCKGIEQDMGRVLKAPEHDSSGRRIYRSRVIDIDILFHGTERCSTETLTLPHPLMSQRDFVMIPLEEIVSEEMKSAFPEIFQGNCK